MGHNLHGDISQEDRELAEELLRMENVIDLDGEVYGFPDCARMLVCLSHDWYDLGDDDKGRALLEKAEKICPGYFDNEIKMHIKEDPMYDYLVQSLAAKILAVARSIVG